MIVAPAAVLFHHGLQKQEACKAFKFIWLGSINREALLGDSGAIEGIAIDIEVMTAIFEETALVGCDKMCRIRSRHSIKIEKVKMGYTHGLRRVRSMVLVLVAMAATPRGLEKTCSPS